MSDKPVIDTWIGWTLAILGALIILGLPVWFRIVGWIEDSRRRDELARADAIANQQRRRPHPSAAGVLFCARCDATRVGSEDRVVARTGMHDEVEVREWACDCGHANTYRTVQPTTPRRGK